MYPYAIVENALAKAFEIAPASLGALRGRIQHFQRLGMVPSNPGKGRKISYERHHIYKWAIGLSLAEFGIDPRLIRYVIENYIWKRVDKYLVNDDSEVDKLLVFYPNILSGFAQYEDKRTVGALICDVVDSLSDLERRRDIALHEILLSQRLGMINLGHLRRSVEKGLLEELVF